MDQIGKLWSLTQLNVDDNLIEIILDATFQPLYDLELVSLRGNRLAELGQSTLNGLEQKCTQLDLSSNHIGSVHSDSFRRIKNIRCLNLSNNTIRKLVLPPTMDRLTELLLSNNRLSTFPDGLYNLPSIEVLDLHNNVMEIMPSVDIGGSQHGVRLVDLSKNRLRNVDGVRLVGSLDVVNVGDNELADIGADVLADASFIRELNLSSNALGSLPVAVTLAVNRVARLYASRCSLTSLDNWVVAKSPSTRLVELSLSGNRLTVLPPTVVASVSSSLEDLDVRGNLLSTLDRQLSYGRTSLRRLSLAGNPWICDCELGWLRDLSVTIDNATCWTPSTTTGELVVCYNIDDCVYVDPRAAALEEQSPDYPSKDARCERIAPTGLCTSKQ